MLKELFFAICHLYLEKVPFKLRRGISAIFGKSDLSKFYRNRRWPAFRSLLLRLAKQGKLTGLTGEQKTILEDAHSYDDFMKIFLTFYDKEKQLFDFNGAKIPCLLSHESINDSCSSVFFDTFLVPLFFNNCHERHIVEQVEPLMLEGPYGWQDDGFDVTVHKGDIVIDAGAWIGDFAAYAASKGADVYAFEPTTETFAMLEETARLNGHITPVQQGLSDKTGSVEFFTIPHSSGNSYLASRIATEHAKTETVAVTTLDGFVREHNIPRIDFIKADIEGAERDMLKGARHVLKTFAPRLALSTYHLPDDPEVMARLIKEANPNYRIIQRKKKLYACVG